MCTIDVHKRTVVACRLTISETGERAAQTQTFGTTAADLLRLSDWLGEGGCTDVGLESTGEYWKPVYTLLEGNFDVWLLNAQHIKAVPGRKTAVKDAQWIAELLAHGLVRPKFYPAARAAGRARPHALSGELCARARHADQSGAEAAGKHQSKTLLGPQQCTRSDVAARFSPHSLPARPIRTRSPTWRAASNARSATARRSLQGRLRPHQSFVLAELLTQIDGWMRRLSMALAAIRQEPAGGCA